MNARHSPPSSWRAAQAQLSAKWQSLQKRERTLVAIATSVVLLAVVWLVAIAPAWRVYTSYASSSQALERQVQQMQAMRQYALQMQAELASSTAGGAASPTAMAKAIETSAQRLLDTKTPIPLVGDRVTVRFQNVAAPQLLQWLQQVRESTRAQAAQVQLSRSASGGTPAAGAANIALWSGQVVLALPIDAAR